MARIQCLNASGESIPPGGCVRLTSINGFTTQGELLYDAIKPDGEDGFHYFNGPVTVPVGQTFFVEQLGIIVRALVEAGTSFGDVVGPQPDSWELSTDGVGFALIGVAGPDGLIPTRIDADGASPVVVLAEDLDAADDRFDDANLPTALAHHVKRLYFGGQQIGWEIDYDSPITLVNRGENVQYAADTLGTYGPILEKLHFFPLDCTPEASSSSSASGSPRI